MINFILGLNLGFLCGVFFVYFANYIKNKRILQGIEDVFKNILDNINKVSFTKRINQYVYLKFEKFEIIFNLNNKEIHIFQEEKCIYTSNQLIENHVIRTLQDKILSVWDKDINDVININNAIVSVNVMKKEFREMGVMEEDIDSILSERYEKEEIEFNLDDILDKINQVGYNNLTDEEKDFLKNVSK